MCYKQLTSNEKYLKAFLMDRLNISMTFHKINVGIIFLVLINFLFEALFPNTINYFTLGQFNIYPMDVISIISTILVIIYTILKKFRVREAAVLPYILGLFILISYFRGVNTFGIESASLYLRRYLYFYIVLLQTVVFGIHDKFLLNIVHIWIKISWVLLGLMILRWGLIALKIIDPKLWISPGRTAIRTINAGQTFILLQALIFIIVCGKNKLRKRIPFHLILFLIFAIILVQQRTVWVVLLIIFPIIFLTQRRARPFFIIISIVAIFIVFIFLIFLMDSSIFTNFTDTIQNLGTFTWRVNSWIQLLNQKRYTSILDYFIGQPFGTGFSRYFAESGWDLKEVTPHNFYILTFLKIGGVGLIILLLLYFQTMISLLRKKNNNISLAFMFILLSQLIYSISYSPGYEQGILLGFAILLSAEKG